MSTKLDYQQVIKAAYDEASEAIKVLQVGSGGSSGSDVVINGVNTTDTLNVSENFTILSSVDTSSINGSSGAFTQVIASLSDDCCKIIPYDTTGIKVGLYTGAPASEQLLVILGPGQDQPIPCSVITGTRLSVRSMESGGASGGSLILTFIGRT
jgi:hypothetical protein